MKTSRPRSYRFKAADGFANLQVAEFDAALTECAERLHDLVYSLTSGQLCNAPAPAGFSIAQFVKHIIWGECQWIYKISDIEVPEALVQKTRGGNPADFSTMPAVDVTSDELCGLIHEGRYNYSREALKTIVDFHKEIDVTRGPADVREVLMHLTWHYTYHTGQIGLLRDFAGAEYTWLLEGNGRD